MKFTAFSNHTLYIYTIENKSYAGEETRVVGRYTLLEQKSPRARLLALYVIVHFVGELLLLLGALLNGLLPLLLDNQGVTGHHAALLDGVVLVVNVEWLGREAAQHENLLCQNPRHLGQFVSQLWHLVLGSEAVNDFLAALWFYSHH